MEDGHHYRDGSVYLYKRGRSKKWQARIKLPKQGWKRLSTGETDLKVAAEIACEQFDEIRFRLKHKMALDTRRFKDVAKLAIKEMEDELEAGAGRKSYHHYIGTIERYMIPFFGNSHIDTITAKKMKKFEDWRIEKIGKRPATSTLNNHNASLRRVFNLAVRKEWIHESKVPDLRTKGRGTSNRRPSFTLEEYIKLYRFMRKFHKTGRKEQTRQIREMLRDYVLILANTGIRHGTEALTMRWRNIEEFTHTDGKKYLRLYVNGKTGQRELIARHGCRRYFERIKDRFEDLKDLENGDLFKSNELVFRIRNGSQPKDLHGAFETLLKEAGLLEDKHGKRRSLYSLRHTYATFRLLNGMEIHLLAVQMGTSVGMIEKHYSHLLPTLAAHQLGGEYSS